RTPRVSRDLWRSCYRPALWQDAREPQSRDRGRDARVHRYVPGHGGGRALGGFRRDRRLFRNAGESGALPRQPLPESVGCAGGLTAAAAGRSVASSSHSLALERPASAVDPLLLIRFASWPSVKGAWRLPPGIRSIGRHRTFTIKPG